MSSNSYIKTAKKFLGITIETQEVLNNKEVLDN